MGECKNENCLKDSTVDDGGYCSLECCMVDLEDALERRYEMHNFQNEEAIRDKHCINKLEKENAELKGLIGDMFDDFYNDMLDEFKSRYSDLREGGGQG